MYRDVGWGSMKVVNLVMVAFWQAGGFWRTANRLLSDNFLVMEILVECWIQNIPHQGCNLFHSCGVFCLEGLSGVNIHWTYHTRGVANLTAVKNTVSGSADSALFSWAGHLVLWATFLDFEGLVWIQNTFSATWIFFLFIDPKKSYMDFFINQKKLHGYF